MAPVSIPPPKMVSNPVEPVVICTNSDRLEWISVAVVNPIGTILHASRRISLVDSHRIMNTPPSARILSAFCSLMPLIVHRVFLGVNATASTVWKPASESFLVSCAEIPASYNFDFFFQCRSVTNTTEDGGDVPGVWPPRGEPAIQSLLPLPLRPAG